MHACVPQKSTREFMAAPSYEAPNGNSLNCSLRTEQIPVNTCSRNKNEQSTTTQSNIMNVQQCSRARKGTLQNPIYRKSGKQTLRLKSALWLRFGEVTGRGPQGDFWGPSHVLFLLLDVTARWVSRIHQAVLTRVYFSGHLF